MLIKFYKSQDQNLTNDFNNFNTFEGNLNNNTNKFQKQDWSAFDYKNSVSQEKIQNDNINESAEYNANKGINLPKNLEIKANVMEKTKKESENEKELENKSNAMYETLTQEVIGQIEKASHFMREVFWKFLLLSKII